jgi:hypothetical protein
MCRARSAPGVPVLCLTLCLAMGVWAGNASDSDVFDVRAYGARGDDDWGDTQAIQDAPSPYDPPAMACV